MPPRRVLQREKPLRPVALGEVMTCNEASTVRSSRGESRGYNRAMYGERSTQVARIFGTTVHTNLEATLIMLASGLAGSSFVHGVFIVLGFALGTALHLGAHWAVSSAFGKGIDRMVLTRAGRIDYSGAPPRFAEAVLRTSAGPTMNAACAVGGSLLLASIDLTGTTSLAVETFTWCSWVLVAINFLPAIPLDGGLILQRALERRLGESRALAIAAHVSFVLTLAMCVVGLEWRQPVLVYLGIVLSYDTWQKHLRPQPRLERAAA